MVCVKKSNILSRVFILQIRPGKVVLYILERKEWFLDPKSKVLNSPKIGRFPRFLSKNRIFYQGCLFRKLQQKRSIFDILDRKERFLDQKSEVLKSPKIGNFSKGLVPGFCQKIEYFIRGICFANSTRKERFIIFWIEKNAFYTM